MKTIKHCRFECIFDKIISLKKEDSKADYIKDPINSIFI